jgi:hypothetical protein
MVLAVVCYRSNEYWAYSAIVARLRGSVDPRGRIWIEGAAATCVLPDSEPEIVRLESRQCQQSDSHTRKWGRLVPSARRCHQDQHQWWLPSMTLSGWEGWSCWPRIAPCYEPWTCEHGRPEHPHCIWGGGARHIALTGSLGDAGLWNATSHPQQWWHGGSRSCSSENTAMKILLTPSWSHLKSKHRNLYKANSSKEKAKTELFPKDSVLELNTTKLGNSPSFLTITHITLFAKWFRSYGILMTDIAAEFCFWTEPQLIRILTFGLRIDRNSGSSKYHYSSQLSLLSDGPWNGSK